MLFPVAATRVTSMANHMPQSGLNGNRWFICRSPPLLSQMLRYLGWPLLRINEIIYSLQNILSLSEPALLLSSVAVGTK